MQFLRDSILFGIVGAIGFLVDVLLLYSIVGFVGLFYGRAISFLSAVLVTWLLNRRLTFRHRSSNLASSHELSAYLILMLIGGSLNYAIYAGLLVSYPFVMQHPVIGVLAGTISGMFVNFFLLRFVLFSKTKQIIGD